MPCQDLHVNVQDASGDLILAGELLTRHETNWQLWTDKLNKRRRGKQQVYRPLREENEDRIQAEEEDQHVGHVLGHMREGGKKFASTPRLRRGETPDSCRIFGSLEGNKVQGDFHITARGHGYVEWGAQKHLDHGSMCIWLPCLTKQMLISAAFNFSHYVTELSFGPHYPSLLNPLDKTISTTSAHFYKFQYYLSIVPTIFTKRRVSTKSGSLDPAAIPQPPSLDLVPLKSKDGKEVSHVINKLRKADPKTVFTNQYAATSQSREISENNIPGIFFKYDIEPILLIVAEQRSSFLSLLVRLVNLVSGVLVGGGWMFQLSEWLGEVMGRKGRRRSGGVLHGRHATVEDDHDD